MDWFINSVGSKSLFDFAPLIPLLSLIILFVISLSELKSKSEEWVFFW